MPAPRHFSFQTLALLGGLLAPPAVSHAQASPAPGQLIEVRKIWEHAPHNAFTDLVRFKGKWFCVFREGQAHVSGDGALRVIVSPDGANWTSAALFHQRTATCATPKSRSR